MMKAGQLAILLAATAGMAAAGSARIAGVVVDSESGAPLAHVRVLLAPEERLNNERFVFTDAAGRFAFDIADGHYRLMTEVQGARQNFGERVPGTGLGCSIIAGPGLDTANLVFRRYALGAIGGRVVDEAGEPVEAALVQLLRYMVMAGRKRVVTAQWAWTNDLGEYRFGPLPAGAYFLAVSGHPWYTQEGVRARVGANPSELPRRVAFVPQYFPNTTDPTRAGAIVLNPGGEARADFALTPTPAVALRVHCEGLEGTQKLVSLIRDGIRGTEAFERQQHVNGDVEFHVPPGHYLVRATATSANTDYSASQPIDAEGGETEVRLTLRQVPAVAGVVEFPEGVPRPSSTMLVHAIREDNGRTFGTVVHADGSFLFPSLPAGKYRVTATATGYLSTGFRAEGAEQKGEVVDLSEETNARLRVFASIQVGRLKGFVMNGERAVAGVMVVLAPKEAADLMEYRGFQTDSDGSFDYQNVRAGEYLLFAVDQPGLEYTNREAIRPFLAGARGIIIGPGTAGTERIPLAGTGGAP
jgi:hypothetical protein